MKRQPIHDIKVNLPVSIFLQGDVYIAYTPALDISTYGSSKAEAKKNFDELVFTFLSEFDDSRELDQFLVSFGWTKHNALWQPPEIKETQVTLPASLMPA